jgi:type IV secretory pathway TrbD component
MALRRIAVHRVGNRPNLFLGADREMIMFVGLVSFALIYSAQKLVATVFGVFLWFGCLFLFRLMAKSDPLLRHVYLRHRLYKTYYPPRSTPFRTNKKEYR